MYQSSDMKKMFYTFMIVGLLKMILVIKVMVINDKCTSQTSWHISDIIEPAIRKQVVKVFRIVFQMKYFRIFSWFCKELNICRLSGSPIWRWTVGLQTRKIQINMGRKARLTVEIKNFHSSQTRFQFYPCMILSQHMGFIHILESIRSNWKYSTKIKLENQ